MERTAHQGRQWGPLLSRKFGTPQPLPPSASGQAQNPQERGGLRTKAMRRALVGVGPVHTRLAGLGIYDRGRFSADCAKAPLNAAAGLVEIQVLG